MEKDRPYDLGKKDHPYTGQPRCDCGAFLTLEPDVAEEVDGKDRVNITHISEWTECKKCGQPYGRFRTK